MKGTIFAVFFTVAFAEILGNDTPIGNNNDDPSEAANICAASGSSGILVAHENCNQFYKCSYGNPVALSCPTGLLFDPTRDLCDWANLVNCGNRIIPNENDETEDEQVIEDGGNGRDDPSQASAICAAEGSDHSYVAHEICNKYYQCWAGQPVALPCPDGTLWSPKKNYCDFPYNVDCGDRIITDNNKPDQEDQIDSDDDEVSGNDISTGNNHDDPSEATNICAASGSSGVLIAHENCNQFYKCTYGNPVALSCPTGLLFDPTKDYCDWANLVNCGNRVIPNENENTEDEQVIEDGGDSDGRDDPSQASAICAAEGSDNSYVAHEACNQFYQCWAGQPVALPCPSNTLWSPKKNYCDFPYNVDCGDRLVPEVL